MTGAEYMAFVGASVILAVTPGPDTFLTLRFAARSVRGGLVYTVAAGLGVLVWAVLALTGVAALLERFPDVRTGLTWVGGTYLVFLGVSALLQVRKVLKQRRAAESPPQEAVEAEMRAPVAHKVPVAAVAGGATQVSTSPATAGPADAPDLVVASAGTEASGQPHLPARSLPTVFRTGLISSLTNPKTGLFFLALLPPFLPESPGPVDHVVLVATVVGCMLVYGAGLSVVAGRVGRFLTGGSGPLIVDGAAGAILIILGVSLIAL